MKIWGGFPLMDLIGRMVGSMKEAIITIIGPAYYTRLDQDAFFWWLKRMEFIVNTSFVGAVVVLHIAPNRMNDKDLENLIALFYRYDIPNKRQLQFFVTKDNKSWFKDDTDQYWHDDIFGSIKKEEK